MEGIKPRGLLTKIMHIERNTLNKGRRLHMEEMTREEGCALETTYVRDHVLWRVFTYKEQGEGVAHSSGYTNEKKKG